MSALLVSTISNPEIENYRLLQKLTYFINPFLNVAKKAHYLSNVDFKISRI